MIKEGGDKNRQKLCLRKDTMTILKKTSLNDNDLTYNINKYDITVERIDTMFGRCFCLNVWSTVFKNKRQLQLFPHALVILKDKQV